MKQELFAAAILLAIGAVLWNWQSEQSGTPPNLASNLQHAANADVARLDSSIDSSVQQATWQEPIDSSAGFDSNKKQANNSASKTSPIYKGDSGNKIQPSFSTDLPADLKIASSDAVAAQLLRQLADQINQSGPLQSTFTLHSSMFDVELTASGRYWQIGAGEGGRKSRMELSFGDQANGGASNGRGLLQISDGRFMFQVNRTGGQQQIKFVDTQRLENQDAHLAIATTPAAWVNKGSMADLFTNLSDAFQFRAPVQRTIAGRDLIELTGQWNPQHLGRLLDGLVAPEDLMPVIKMNKVPEQIPQAVTVVLQPVQSGSDRISPPQFIPASIEFFKFKTAGKSSVEKQSIVQIQFDRFEHVATLDERLFRLESSAGEAIDMTDVYNRRIDTIVGENKKVAVEDIGGPFIPAIAHETQFPGSSAPVLR